MALLRRRAVPKGVLIGFAVALLVCGLLVPLAGGAAEDQQLAAAQARWAARSFASYRLVVQEETRASSCRQSVEILNEKIERVLENRCVRLPSWTVTNLFTWLAQANDATTRCYPSAVTCVCYAVYSLRPQYDPLLGYPQSVTYAWTLRLNWTYLGHWRRMWRTGELPTCANIARFAGDHITITIVALTPLR